LFTAKCAVVQLISWGQEVIFDEMIMISSLYMTNMLSLIF